MNNYFLILFYLILMFFVFKSANIITILIKIVLFKMQLMTVQVKSKNLSSYHICHRCDELIATDKRIYKAETL